ncbi:hypothetical protein GGI43DRAFT_142768 [Trichoderma evansii]
MEALLESLVEAVYKVGRYYGAHMPTHTCRQRLTVERGLTWVDLHAAGDNGGYKEKETKESRKAKRDKTKERQSQYGLFSFCWRGCILFGRNAVCHAARIFLSSFRILQPVYLIQVSTLLFSLFSLCYLRVGVSYWALVCGYRLQYYCPG